MSDTTEKLKDRLKNNLLHGLSTKVQDHPVGSAVAIGAAAAGAAYFGLRKKKDP